MLSSTITVTVIFLRSGEDSVPGKSIKPSIDANVLLYTLLRRAGDAFLGSLLCQNAREAPLMCGVTLRPETITAASMESQRVFSIGDDECHVHY